MTITRNSFEERCENCIYMSMFATIPECRKDSPRKICEENGIPIESGFTFKGWPKVLESHWCESFKSRIMSNVRRAEDVKKVKGNKR